MKKSRVMEKGALKLMILFLIVFAIGCAAKSTYQAWNDQLKQMLLDAQNNAKFHTKEDISFLVGQRPDRCQTIKTGMKIGFFSKKMTVTLVISSSPAAEAGLRQGDVICSINSIVVRSDEEMNDVMRGVHLGEPLIMGTHRGPISLIPRALKQEQCYWEIRGGSVARSVYGAGSASYQRFFRLTARFVEGTFVNFTANWQQ
ncbi:MAG: PDZ domain-containing protein [Candidatus Aenigmarchaeota archaeon]|nr:PDZ domain-containing protein [Candidatus Aenigmarchaeota archaeon]